jgi:hypothetical protein
MLCVLSLCHSRLDLVPKTIDTASLYGLAMLCDKYDIFDLVKPSISGWIENWAVDYSNREVVTHEDLMICWIFGLTRTFSNVAKDLTLQLRQDDEDNYETADGNEFCDLGLPQDTIGRSTLDATVA